MSEADRAAWWTPGVVMVVLAVLYTVVNILRAITDPSGFAQSFGLAESAAGDGGFVLVYAIRMMFVAGLAGALLARRDVRALTTFAAVSVVMPLGDAALVAGNSGPAAVIARHLAVAAFLTMTWWLLRRRVPR